MKVDRLVRDGMAYTLRNVPFKGRWRVGKLANRLFRPEEVRVHLPEAGWVTIDLRDQSMSSQLYWVGVGNDDKALIRLIQKFLGERAVFVDIGANIGIYSLAVARHLAPLSGRVIGFEPHPCNFEIFRRNIALNRLENVVAEPLGVADRSERLSVAGEAFSGNWSLSMSGPNRFEITLTALDDYLADHPVERIDVIKMDIEGAETRALRGARGALGRHRPVLALEANPGFLHRMGSSLEELLATVAELGYAPYQPDGPGLKTFPADYFRSHPGREMTNLLAFPLERVRESLERAT